ncbi:hypothetical protein VTL71DRAFT_4125 [Oculimacula yallundae]|uniref:Uncharacterized protein n=1 Tax=Oculimacula yallundae TaxID=86028 RepID=A0ABR4C4Z6_9HELO
MSSPRPQDSPAKAQTEGNPRSGHDSEDNSSQSSHSRIDIGIDSQPTNPSHSTPGKIAAGEPSKPLLRPSSSSSSSSDDYEDSDDEGSEADTSLFQDVQPLTTTPVKTDSLTHHANELSSASSSSSSSSESEDSSSEPSNTEAETDLFQDTQPTPATLFEIESFSQLANDLSLFAFCFASSQAPDLNLNRTPSRSPSPSPLSIQIITTPSHSLDEDKTPIQASEASLQGTQAEASALIEQRKADLKRDLMELISDEEGVNRELIMGIDRLLRDWKALHEGLERWRGELKGEKVREVCRREREALE